MTQTQYQPKTGKPCTCKPGQHRDNCPLCEGTGERIDFAAIRARRTDNGLFALHFTGRKVGAIGVHGQHTVTLVADSEEAAKLALYDTHEHILNLTVLRAEDNRQKHHFALAAVFGVHPANGLPLWCKLRRLEAQADAINIRQCNDPGYGTDAAAADRAVIRTKVASLGGRLPDGFFINTDPRGYALKIESEQAAKFPGLHTDWGKYGCLAAEIDNN